MRRFEISVSKDTNPLFVEICSYAEMTKISTSKAIFLSIEHFMKYHEGKPNIIAPENEWDEYIHKLNKKQKKELYDDITKLLKRLL